MTPPKHRASHQTPTSEPANPPSSVDSPRSTETTEETAATVHDKPAPRRRSSRPHPSSPKDPASPPHHPKHPAHLREQIEDDPKPLDPFAVWPMGAREIAMQIEVQPRYLPTELDHIYIQGDHAQIGHHREKGLRLHRHKDGIWRNTVRLKAGEVLHFKVHRGDSETLGLDAKGRPANFHVSLQQSGNIRIEIDGWLDHDYRPKPSIQGRLDIYRKLTFPHLRARDVLVWLPSSYDRDPTRRYPVLYMHDGQNLFDPATSYIGVEWAVDENIERLEAMEQIDAPIVVGIKNTPDRLEEYAPTEKGYAYMRFVIEVVKPMVDERYRTRPTREHTAVMGSSLGGLASFMLAWCHPEVFSKAGCLSPVFLNREELNVDVCAWVEQYTDPKKDIRLYIDNGGLGLEQRLMEGCDRMVALLEQSGYQHGNDLAWFLDADAHHTESAWAARLWRPLTFLFGSYDPDAPLDLPSPEAPAAD